MAQSDFGTIDPNTKSGTQLATDLNGWRDAVHSLHAGTSRPSYVTQGMLWLDTTNDPVWDLKLYDGSADITLGAFNSTSDVFTPSNAGLLSGSIADFSGALGVVRPVLSKSSGYTAIAADRHKLIDFTASAALSLEPAATLGNGWEALVRANGGAVTIDPDGAETINGASTYALADGQSALIVCDGTEIFAHSFLYVLDEDDMTSDSAVLPASQQSVKAYIENNQGGGAPDVYVEDQKSSGTDGGTFTAGAWQTRDLNTVVRNALAGASLGSNRLTLPAGTYFAKALAIARAVNGHQLKLYDTTNTADLIVGLSARAASTGQNATSSLLQGVFTLSGSADIELQHYCQTTAATTGFGGDGAASVINVYAQLGVWKIS